MKIVRFNAGLGNQMFQYVFYECLKKRYPHEIIKADLSPYEKYNPHNGFELDKVFNIKLVLANKEEVEKLADDKKNWYHRIRRKIFGQKQSYYKEPILAYNDSVFAFSNSILFNGYWVSWRYCHLLDVPIHTLFTFPMLSDNNNLQLLKQIQHTESVGIHIRRGDYYSSSAIKSHGNVTTLQYYQKSIAILEKKIKKSVFFIFSDEPEWVKNNFKINNAVVISHNKGQYAYRDLQLMSLCKHQIIANSTFSWWSAYLNQNPNKIVISPAKWFNQDTILNKIEDILPLEWLKI